MERKYCSNNSVKSKRPLQGPAAGPKALSQPSIPGESDAILLMMSQG